MTIDDELVAAVRAAVADARSIRRLPIAPPPLVASPKCPRCSLVGICLPDETTALTTAGDERHGDAPAESEATVDGEAAPADRRPRGAVRPLVAPREDRVPLYVQAHGAVIGRDGECLKIRQKDGTTSTARLREVSQVNVFGNVTITTPALQELCQRGIDVGLFGFGGWYYGSVGGFPEKNVLLRVAQFACASDASASLAIARELVIGKILNCRTLLRRNAEQGDDGLLSRLKRLSQLAAKAETSDVLLGLEGTAARAYFEHFAALLSPRTGASLGTFSFASRNRRPPRDPVNALLSFGYALLTKDCKVALQSVGFDPMVGLYHRPRPGKPALALDLMEEFRPLVVDSVVLAAVNTEVVRAEHFVHAAGGCALTEAGRRAFLAAYERRMETEVSHPIFGYSLSYRRVLRIQARLLARTVQGELRRYPSFRTR